MKSSTESPPMLITRYLFKNLLTVTLFVTVTLTLVIWLTQSLKFLELIANSDAPPSLFLKLVALTLPKFFEVILPIALVTAVLFVYNKMIMDNEMVVMRASGMNQYELARAALLLSGGVTMILLFMTTWISPKCAAEMQGLRQTIQMQYSSFLLREGVFNTFGSDLTVYLRSRSKSGDLQGLMIHDNRDKDAPPITITAKKGRIVMEGGIPNIIVYDGMRQQIDTEGGTTSRLYFSRYTLEIKGLEDTAPERWREANERSFWELLHPDLTNKRDRSQRELFFVEANNRLITPLNAFGFTLVALAAVLLGPFNRRGQNKKVLLGAALVVAMQLLNIGLVNLSKKHPELLPLLYLNTLIPVAGGLYLLHIRGEQHLMTFLRRWNKLSESPV